MSCINEVNYHLGSTNSEIVKKHSNKSGFSRHAQGGEEVTWFNAEEIKTVCGGLLYY